jgi:hypothetical protein
LPDLLPEILTARAGRSERCEPCASQCPQFTQHLFGVDKTTGLKVLLGGQEGSVKSGTILWVEPVARIEGQKINVSALRELCGLGHQESGTVNTSLDRHGRRLP